MEDTHVHISTRMASLKTVGNDVTNEKDDGVEVDREEEVENGAGKGGGGGGGGETS